MAETKTAPKAPAPEVVEKAHEKIESGDDLSKREAAAVEAQDAIDQERGYRKVDWKGIPMYQSLITGHTAPSEYEIVQHHAQLDKAGIVDPRA